MLQTQKLESLGVLAGGIAHDFNNLLVSMLGNVDLALARTNPDSEGRPFLLKIDAAAQRAAELANQMLSYSGRGRFVVEPIDLSRLVEETGQLLSTAVSKRAAVRYDLKRDLPPIEADATQLRQVVMNLLTNASDALGEQDGVITVRTGVAELGHDALAEHWLDESLTEGRYVWLEVADTGCGMDAETRKRIFDPFFTTKQSGRGLGLAATLGIVRGHRGGLHVDSAPGEGTVFRLAFPAPGLAAAPAAANPPAAPGTFAARPEGQGVVLVADDEPEVLEVVRTMLESAGYGVLPANDGVEAVAIFRARREEIVAVVLDLTMPRMNGEETLLALRRIEPGLRVVISSGYSGQDTIHRVLDGDRTAFIQKPYRTQALIDAVRSV
jgi:CheY-like chemotaxis protein